ncbi:MAG: TadE family protein [Pseudomonadota bacterium]
MRSPAKLHSGVAAIEFALLLVVLVPIAFGTTELGRAFFQYNTLVKAVRDGARVLSSASGGANLAEARCVTLYGNPLCSGELLLPKLDEAGLFSAAYDQPRAAGAVNITVASVTINGYHFVSLVPYVIPDITFGPISATMRQGGL